MENPYQSPNADLVNIEQEVTDGQRLASKWKRLFAAIIDGVIGILVALPFWLLTGFWEMITSGNEPPLQYTLLGGVYGFIAFLVVHGYLLKKSGQTVGKKLLGTKITDLDGNLPDLTTLVVKRYLPISVVSIIPMIGPMLSLIDIVFIFRQDRRCVHDLIAGTKVVDAQ